jgi:hypothetical protein
MSAVQHTPGQLHRRTFVAADGKWSPKCATCGGWLKYHGLATGSCDTPQNIVDTAKTTGSAA